MNKREKSYIEFMKGSNTKAVDKAVDSLIDLESVESDVLKKAKDAYKLFFSANRSPIHEKHKGVLEQSRQAHVCVNGKKIFTYSWGKGPRVLLVHGIDGYGGQFSRFVQPLIDKGFSVTAFDAPGHGQSEGEGTNADEMEAAIRAMEALEGQFHSIIAHSVGCVWALWALRQGLRADSLVVISPPARQSYLINVFIQIMQLPNEVASAFMQLLKNAWGEDMVEKYSANNIVRSINTRSLIIHGDKDDLVPLSEGGQRLHEVWKHSEFMLAPGLDHSNILRDQSVVEKAVDFII